MVMVLFMNALSLAPLYKEVERSLPTAPYSRSAWSRQTVFKGAKPHEVTELELVPGARGQATQKDAVFEIKV